MNTPTDVLGLVSCFLVLTLAAGCNQNPVSPDTNDDSTIPDVSGDTPMDASSETGSDASSDAPTGGTCSRPDAFGGWRADRLDGPLPNRCCEESEARRLLTEAKDQSAPLWTPEIPFKWMGSNNQSQTITATFEGNVQLQSSVQFQCPPFTDSLGLTCTTDQALSFSEVGQSNKMYKIALGVPLGEIDLPSAGTKVEINIEKDPRTLRIHTKGTGSSGDLIYASISALQEFDSDKPSNAFSYTLAGASISMAADVTNPTSAHCIFVEDCPRLFRVEPLEIKTASSQTVDTGETATFSANGENYKFWHGYSLRRSDRHVNGWTVSGCSDPRHAYSRFAIARQ